MTRVMGSAHSACFDPVYGSYVRLLRSCCSPKTGLHAGQEGEASLPYTNWHCQWNLGQVCDGRCYALLDRSRVLEGEWYRCSRSSIREPPPVVSRQRKSSSVPRGLRVVVESSRASAVITASTSYPSLPIPPPVQSFFINSSLAPTRCAPRTSTYILLMVVISAAFHLRCTLSTLLYRCSITTKYAVL